MDKNCQVFMRPILKKWRIFFNLHRNETRTAHSLSICPRVSGIILILFFCIYFYKLDIKINSSVDIYISCVINHTDTVRLNSNPAKKLLSSSRPMVIEKKQRLFRYAVLEYNVTFNSATCFNKFPQWSKGAFM